MSEENDLSQEEKFNAINWWQSQENLHPLTCITSNHRKLEVKHNPDGKIILYCKDCDYTQENIPESVYSIYRSRERFTELWKLRKKNSSISQK